MKNDPTVGVLINEGKVLGGDGLEELRAALADAGQADPPWREVSKSKKAPPQVIDLVENCGVDRLLVWGGDGTVRRCIGTLLREGHENVSIGVLPAGTGNLLATNLGVPIELRGAVDVAVHGDPQPIDVGIVNDEQHFVVMAGAGFDALFIEEADDSGLKDRWGRLGYVWAGVRHRHVSPAQAGAAVWVSVAFLVGRGRSRIVRGMLFGAGVALGVIVAGTRVALGVHWTTDVIIGLVIGWSWFAVCAVVFGGRRLRPADPVRRSGEETRNPQSVSDRTPS